MSPEELQNFKDWGVPLPQREAHGTETDIRSNMQRLRPTNWRMQGNRLIADTEVGELSQTMPTNLILTGTDKEGLPIFKKI